MSETKKRLSGEEVRTLLELNRKNIDESAARAHEALRATLGTSGAPTLARVTDAIEMVAQWMQERPEQDVWALDGMLIQVHRNFSPFPAFEIFVRAADRMYIRPPDFRLTPSE